MITMKELNEDGKEYVDGRPVEMYEMKFSGSVLLTPDEAASISAGDIVSLLVTAQAQPPVFREVKKGKSPNYIKRVNSLKLQDLTPLSQDKAKFMYDSIGDHVEGVNDGVVDVSYKPKEEEKDLGFNPEELF